MTQIKSRDAQTRSRRPLKHSLGGPSTVADSLCRRCYRGSVNYWQRKYSCSSTSALLHGILHQLTSSLLRSLPPVQQIQPYCRLAESWVRVARGKVTTESLGSCRVQLKTMKPDRRWWTESSRSRSGRSHGEDILPDYVCCLVLVECAWIDPGIPYSNNDIALRSYCVARI